MLVGGCLVSGPALRVTGPAQAAERRIEELVKVSALPLRSGRSWIVRVVG